MSRRCRPNMRHEQPAPGNLRAGFGGTARRHNRRQSIILLGASTGGVDALLQIICHFSQDCPPTLIVQHTGDQFTKSLVRLFDASSNARVMAADDGMLLETGHIYLSPGAHVHLCLAASAQLRVKLCPSAARLGHRPSVDALFDSAVPHARNVTAAILTGMGKDGANGLAALRRAGARTFGQDRATSVVYGMPRAALAIGAIERELPIAKIGWALLDAAQQGQTR